MIVDANACAFEWRRRKESERTRKVHSRLAMGKVRYMSMKCDFAKACKYSFVQTDLKMMCFTWHFSVFLLKKGRLCNSAFSLHTTHTDRDISACIGTSPIHQYHAFTASMCVLQRVSTLKSIGKCKQRNERRKQTNKQISKQNF